MFQYTSSLVEVNHTCGLRLESNLVVTLPRGPCKGAQFAPSLQMQEQSRAANWLRSGGCVNKACWAH